MSDAIAQLERQAKEVRDGLDSSNSKFQELGKQISELDRQRQAVLAENIKQQGALAELEKAIVALRSGEPSKASTGETVN